MLYVVDDDQNMCSLLSWTASLRRIECKIYYSSDQFLEAVEYADVLNTTPNIAAEDPKLLAQINSKSFQYDPNGDCLLLDVRMNGLNGPAMFDILTAKGFGKRVPIILMTGYGYMPVAVDALKLGAFDFFEKPFDSQQLFERVEEAFQASRDEGRHAYIDDKLRSLTDRERQVLNFIIEGRMNKSIADQLDISMRTVEVHRATILEKMGVKSAVELLRLFGEFRTI